MRTKNPNSFKRIIANVSVAHYKTLERLQIERGFFNISEALRYCISLTDKKEFPSYVDNRPRQTPEEKALDKVLASEKAQELKEQRRVVSKTNICNFLGGEVVNLDGHLHCRYNQYQETGGKKVDISIVTEPIEYLSEESLVNQYQDLMGNKGAEAKVKLQNLMKNS